MIVLIFFLSNVAAMAAMEFYTEKLHLKWKPVSLYHHVITSAAANALWWAKPEIFYNITNVSLESLPIAFQLVPLVTFSYAFFEIYHVFRDRKGLDFLAHGAYMIVTSSLSIYLKIPHWILPELITETSSMFLTIIRFHKSIRYLFAFTFLFCRGILYPYICIKWLGNAEHIFDPTMSLEKVKFVFVIILNCLNGFWIWKIFGNVLTLVVKGRLQQK